MDLPRKISTHISITLPKFTDNEILLLQVKYTIIKR